MFIINNIIKEFDTTLVKRIFNRFNVEFIVIKIFKNKIKIIYIRFIIRKVYKDIIQIDNIEYIKINIQNNIDIVLENNKNISKTKKYNNILKISILDFNCFLFIYFFDLI